MNIYETGKSVADFLVDNKESKYRTYACVLPSAKDYDMETGLKAMKKKLNALGLKLRKKADDPLVYVDIKKKDEYTIAHSIEYVKVKGKIKCVIKPSTIFKHCITRPFTIDGLYVDKAGEIISNHDQAMQDAISKVINLNKAEKMLCYNKDVFPKILEYQFEQGYRLHPHLENDMHCMDGSDLIFDKQKTVELLNKHMTEFIKNYAHCTGLCSGLFGEKGIKLQATL